MNILILPARAHHVRSIYLAKELITLGTNVRYVKAFKPLPYNLDIILSLPYYFLITLLNPYAIAIGAKPYPNVVLPLLVKKLFGTTIVIDVDDLDYGYRKGILSSILKNFWRLFLRYPDIITYHNENIKRLLTESFGINSNKFYHLEQGVNLEIFHAQDKLIEKSKSKDKIIAYTGHLNSAADLAPILKAFRLVIKEEPKTKLMIIGGGERQREFVDLVTKLGIQDKISFTGILPPQDVAKYLSNADLALVYYEDKEVNYYRASVKMREYLALGLPVICNNISDLALFGDYSYQTDFDLQMYADKIIELLRMKGNGREEKARKVIMNNFNWKTITTHFLRFLAAKRGLDFSYESRI